MKILHWRRKICPRCRDRNTRPSTRRKRLESLLSMFLLRPYRCRTCGARFWRFV
jgi:RNase P subunit RPR2